MSEISLSIINDQDEPDGNKRLELQKEEHGKREEIEGDTGGTNTNNLFLELNNKDSPANIDAVLNKLKTLFSNAQRGLSSKRSLYSTLKSGVTMKTMKTMKIESDEEGKIIRKQRKKENTIKKDDFEKKEIFSFDFENMKNYAQYFVKNNCESLSFKYLPKLKLERKKRTEKSLKQTIRAD